MRPHRHYLVASAESGLVNADRWSICQRVALYLFPQGIHCIQLGSCLREPANRQVARIGHPKAARCRVLAGPVLEQHNVPTPPMSANHAQKMLVFLLCPGRSHEQLHIAGRDVDCPVENSAPVAAADRHCDLAADVPIAGIQRRRFGDDCLVEHQQDRPRLVFQPIFEPPFAWRQVAGRWASRCRGRFQRRPNLANARLTLLREVAIP